MGINPVSLSKLSEQIRNATQMTSRKMAEDAKFAGLLRDSFSNSGSVESPYLNYTPASVARVLQSINIQPISSDGSAIDQPESVEAVRFDYENMDLVMPLIHEFREISRTADYSGMSDVEIYQTIYIRYEETFGEQFFRDSAMAHYIGTVGLGQIIGSFHTELGEVFGHEGPAMFNVARKALYGDMSKEEVQGIIAAKYPDRSQMTLRDMIHMTDELSMVGVGEGLTVALSLTISNIAFLPHHSTYAESEELFYQVLDKPFDFQRLCEAINHHLWRKTGLFNSETLALMCRIFDVSVKDGLIDIDSLFFQKK